MGPVSSDPDVQIATTAPVSPTEAVRALARVSRLLERSSSDLSMAHYRVLAAIAAGDERASRIATRLAIGKPTISAAVDALCQRKLLARSDVAGDQRAAALHLTPHGRRLLAEVEVLMTDRLGDVVGRTPDPERVLESLTWLGAAIDQVMAERMTTGQQHTVDGRDQR